MLANCNQTGVIQSNGFQIQNSSIVYVIAQFVEYKLLKIIKNPYFV